MWKTVIELVKETQWWEWIRWFWVSLAQHAFFERLLRAVGRIRGRSGAAAIAARSQGPAGLSVGPI